MALAVPLSRFTPRVGGGSAFFVRPQLCTRHGVPTLPMKNITSFLLVAVVGMSLSTCFAGHLGTAGSPTTNLTYEFTVYTGEGDKWDPAASDEPPLTSGKAMRIATKFVQTVPLRDDMKNWELTSVKLERMSYLGGREEWIYVVHFDGNPGGNWTGFVPWIDIPVRFDGTVPKPTITKSK